MQTAKVLAGAGLVAGAAFLWWRHSKTPANGVPAGNGDVTPIPSIPTPDNPHPPDHIVVLSLPQLETITGVSDLMAYTPTPLRNMAAGDAALVAMRWDGISGHEWWPVPMVIVDADPGASKGHVIARVSDSFLVAGAPNAGTQLSLSTETDDAVANIDPNAPGAHDFLVGQGF
jgi:hypothetical protein